MMPQFVVDIDTRTRTRVVVEAESPDEAKHLVEQIDGRDLAALLLHETTPHDRYVCRAEVLEYDRDDVLRADVDPGQVGEL